MFGVFIHFADKHAGALAALGAGEHLCIDKFHQAPGAGKGQQGLQFQRLHLFVVQAVGFGEYLNRIGI